MEKEQLKKRVCNAIDQHAEKIIETGNRILANPELGYKEHRTAARVEETWRELNLPYENNLALTGSRAILKGKESKVTVALMGEMDAVVCPEHPYADTATGAAHSCGHNAQIAGMLGAAIGLVRSGARQYLAGDVAFFAVPAEELVEVQFRQRLREKGEIEFLSGKQEMIKIGALDDVDMTVMFHTSTAKEGTTAFLGTTSNGFITKLVRYTGREAHAGGEPHKGVNALNAAVLGLQGIHAQRETFRDSDHIRVHPIITRGGDLVNIVPADVRLETYVRGGSMDAVIDAGRKVNRALKAGAMAVGADVEITEIPGFYPRHNNGMLNDAFRANLIDLLGEEHVSVKEHATGSSDIGDVMQIMPAIHPYVAGAEGRAHTKDYVISDENLAYIVPAKALAMTTIDLLADDAGLGSEVKAQKGFMSKKEYLESWEKLTVEAGSNA